MTFRKNMCSVCKKEVILIRVTAVASTSAIDVAIIMIKNILCAVSHLYVVEIYYVEY